MAPWDMANVVAKLIAFGASGAAPDRARDDLRLRPAGQRLPGDPPDAGDRRPGGLRRDPLGPAPRRGAGGTAPRASARWSPPGPRRGRRRLRRPVPRGPPGPRRGPLRRPQRPAARRLGGPARGLPPDPRGDLGALASRTRESAPDRSRRIPDGRARRSSRTLRPAASYTKSTIAWKEVSMRAPSRPQNGSSLVPTAAARPSRTGVPRVPRHSYSPRLASRSSTRRAGLNVSERAIDLSSGSRLPRTGKPVIRGESCPIGNRPRRSSSGVSLESPHPRRSGGDRPAGWPSRWPAAIISSHERDALTGGTYKPGTVKLHAQVDCPRRRAAVDRAIRRRRRRSSRARSS